MSESDARPILAALANPAARDAFARVVLGTASDSPARREERALEQLASAGLIVRVGGEWAVDEGRLRSLLAQGAKRRPKDGPERFLTVAGRIDRYPSQLGEREALLRFIAPRVIGEGEMLSESELGARLEALTTDTALLRRMLVDHGILARDAAGARYWLSGG